MLNISKKDLAKDSGRFIPFSKKAFEKLNEKLMVDFDRFSKCFIALTNDSNFVN